MKYLLLSILLAFSILAQATNYYVSNTGSDSANGLTEETAWQTISKVNTVWNAGTFAPNDHILFKKGDVWNETIVPKESGSSGNPIVIGAYGTGVNPIITGFTTITSGWTNEGGNIYSKSVTSEAIATMLTVNGVQVAMGRTPDTGWLTYESISTNTSITDNQLTGTPSWTGAEAVIKKGQYHIDRCTITNHTNSTLTYTSLGSTGNATAGYGYFFQNSLQTLNLENEWFYDFANSKLYIYGDPTGKTIKIATSQYLVNNAGFDYITFENINFNGCIRVAVYNTTSSDYITVNNCEISQAGRAAMLIVGSNPTATYNYVHDCNGTAFYLSGANTTISNNTVNRIGLIDGQSLIYQYDLSSAIYCSSANGITVTNNSIKNINYNGMFIGPYTATVQYNYVDSTCLKMADGGGIYLTTACATQRLIDHNVIRNTIGNLEGTTGGLQIANGIYLDDECTNVVVTNNSIENSTLAAIQLHFANTNTIIGNTTYGNNRGVWFQNNAAGTSIFSNTVNTNTFFIKETNQYGYLFNSNENDIPSFGTTGNNLFISQTGDNEIMYLQAPAIGIVSQTLAQFKTFSSQETGSTNTNYTANESLFVYNETSASKPITLSQAYVDISGTKYGGLSQSLTLEPYTSKILFIDPNPILPPATKKAGLINKKAGLINGKLGIINH